MKKPQKQLILEHLQKGHSITQLEALRRFGCFRLADVIYKLRPEYPIITKMIKLPSGKWIALYRLIKVGSEVEYENETYYVKRLYINFGYLPYAEIQKNKYARIKTPYLEDLS